MTNYKQLCAELLSELENAIGVIYGEDGTRHISSADAVITKADIALAEPEPEPVAWMYQGEPSFDGTDWRETWEVTTAKRLAEFKATPDQPIPLFSIQPQRQ